MAKISLKKISTDGSNKLDKEEIKAKTEGLVKRIGELQILMAAEEKHACLIVLQGMDASGKDGVIKNVFRWIDPNAFSVKGFKTPSEEEKSHDFLWRVHKECPPKGWMRVFNRSHYEELLIVRVHKWAEEKTIKQRFDQINNFEKHLTENGTHILKFFLHISPEAQLERLEERKVEEEKMWKYNPGDWEERKLWDEYQNCYEDVINKCNNPEWHIIPADKNWVRNYMIAKAIVEKLESLKMKWPRINE